MKISKTMLFGGVLMCAGIANAGVFQFDTDQFGNYSYAFTNAYADGGSYESTGDTSTDLSPSISVQAQSDSWFGGAVINMDTISAEAGSTGSQGGFAYSYARAFLMFDADTDVQIDWDFFDDDSRARIQLVNMAGRFTVFERGNDSGSEVFTFEAGRFYDVQLRAELEDSAGPAASFVTLGAVPAPGAAVLAGVAGLAAVRRRR